MRRSLVDGDSVGRVSARRAAEKSRAHGESQVRRVHDAPLGRTDAWSAQPCTRVAVQGGLLLDEAMHPLTILAVGLYGEVLPNQNGAPLRLVVPWKYGFKGIKSIVRIRLVESQPHTAWMDSNSSEYGFYSNVNPEVDHPRWTQAKERRIGEFFKRPTLMFNGYGDQVASLYTG